MSAPTQGVPAPAAKKRNVRKHYVRVVVTWVVTLAALYAFQQYFS